MDFYFTNTQSKKKELFTSQDNNNVTMYQCGPTLYWDQHIGNLRSVVLADFIVKSLHAAGYKVNFVRNYTDVGHLSGDNHGDADQGTDRMEKAAKRESLSPAAIARKYRENYEKDISLLNTLPPTETPSATEHIEEMQEMIDALIKSEYAYTTPLAVYFDTTKANDYTRLSGQKIDEQIKDSGHGLVTDPEKRNPQDFALWFFRAGAHEKALQFWKSPFTSPLTQNGEGFPGWHIECSAMAKSLLGNTIDIHMGGVEHISIHHTNEIAQSEAANKKEYVHYWLHNEHLLVDGSKMSKSSGTSYLLKDIIEHGYDPLSLRYFFLQAHYRSKQNFTWEALEASSVAFLRLRKSVRSLPKDGVFDQELYYEFLSGLADDINTPRALAVVHKILKSSIKDADKKATIVKCDEVLGLNLTQSDSGVDTFDTQQDIPKSILKLANERLEARRAKNWSLSDEMRDIIRKNGYEITDVGDSYTIVQLS